MYKFLEECKEQSIDILKNELLSQYCSFFTGGCAEYFCTPYTKEHLHSLLKIIKKYDIPLTVIGEGSNVLVPNVGLEGIVVSTTKLQGVSVLDKDRVSFLAGENVKQAAVDLANNGISTLAFMYGMPGTLGGALWMNARCYGKEISDVFLFAEGFTYFGDPWTYSFNKDDFSYKTSLFQKKEWIITDCVFRVQRERSHCVWRTMIKNEIDRRSKGHYSAPCAGSIFKNNYDYGKPSGNILEELDFKGKKRGGAYVNERHANIICNSGTATSQDVFDLSEEMRNKAYEVLHVLLEREIILLGNLSLWKK